jgi:hypothetical protein
MVRTRAILIGVCASLIAAAISGPRPCDADIYTAGILVRSSAQLVILKSDKEPVSTVKVLTVTALQMVLGGDWERLSTAPIPCDSWRPFAVCHTDSQRHSPICWTPPAVRAFERSSLHIRHLSTTSSVNALVADRRRFVRYSFHGYLSVVQ